MRLALYQPDIAQNTGTIIRLGACLGLPVDIIEPAGFAWSERSFRRAGMDYLDHAEVKRHLDFDSFEEALTLQGSRLVLLTTRSDLPYTRFAFRGDDVLLLGSEGAGVPAHVHARADARIAIPMQPAMRSINVALAAAMVAGEALRQTRWNQGA